MALEDLHGFENIASADLPYLFSQANGTISTSVFRNGARALQVSTATSVKQFNLSNATTRVLGFAMRVTSTTGTNRVVAVLSDGDPLTSANVQVGMAMDSTGHLAFYRGRALNSASGGTLFGTSTNAFVNDTWYYVEIVVTHHASTGTLECYVNGTKTGWIDLTNQNTANSGNAYSNAYALTGEATTNYYDDLYTLTGSGGARTSRLGDVKVISILASSGDGSVAQLTPSSGVDNGAMVDETTNNGDTDYNQSTAVGQIDTYNFPVLGSTGAIYGLAARMLTRKTDAGSVDARVVARISSTNYFGSVVSQSQTYRYAQKLWEQSPATSSNWTESEINGAEFGIEHNA